MSLEHDEYFFVRALQAHEMVFTTLTEELGTATQALRRGDVATATARVRRGVAVFDRAAMLFRLVATMRPAAFHAFRQYTEGASAIQSEAYKRFELACGTPTAQRLCSEAFDNVPAVRAEAPGLDNFSRAWHDVGRHGPAAAELARTVAQLEAGHQRGCSTWRGRPPPEPSGPACPARSACRGDGAAGGRRRPGPPHRERAPLGRDGADRRRQHAEFDRVLQDVERPGGPAAGDGPAAVGNRGSRSPDAVPMPRLGR